MAVAAAAPLTRPSPRGRGPLSERDRAERDRAERELLVRYHRQGDLAAREELVERFLPLARDLAQRYSYTDEPFDDLLQVASSRADQGHRPVRARAGHPVHELCGAHHPRAS